MKKRVLILFLGVILSCGITAGILTSGFAAKYMMTNMIRLLNQKKIDKMSFPTNEGPDSRSTSSMHENSSLTCRFDYYIYKNTEILEITFLDFGLGNDDMSRLWKTILRDGISKDNVHVGLMVKISMYDKNGRQIISQYKMPIQTRPDTLLSDIILLLRMDKDTGWKELLEKYDLSRIRIDYEDSSFNLKIVDNNSPYSTIQQIRQMSFWVECPEGQLNDIGKKYDVWK